MIREQNTADLISRYLLVAASMLGIFMLAAAVYETTINYGDSGLDTWLAIVRWTGPSLGLTTTILIYWEVINMILKWLYKNQARREVEREWMEWNRRRENAQTEGRDFNEPNPAERRQQSNNGR